MDDLQASPHYHYNAVELGYFTKGRQIFSCLLDSTTAVTLTAASAPTKFYCNKLRAGSSYTIPQGWLHWLLSPCEPFEVFLTFTSSDYGASFEYLPIRVEACVPFNGFKIETFDT